MKISNTQPVLPFVDGVVDTSMATTSAHLEEGAPNVDDNDGPNTSVFKEDAGQRIIGSKTWLATPTSCLDDFTLYASWVAVTETMMLQSLKLSGTNWEKKQQREFLETGKRSFRLWELFNDKPAHEVLGKASRMIFVEDSLPLFNKTEKTQLAVFLVASRMGGACYISRIVRNRNWDTKLYHTLRDPVSLASLKTCKRCVLEGVAGEHRDRYQTSVGQHVANSELQCGLVMSHIDTGDNERIHSRNDRRRRTRNATHVTDLESLSAAFVNSEFTTVLAHSEKDNKAQPRPLSQDKANRQIHGKRKWGWAWKAFVHIEGHGRLVSDPEVAKDLSQKYRDLDEDSRSAFDAMGKEAAERYYKGLRAFPRRARAPTKRRQTFSSLFVTESGDPLWSVKLTSSKTAARAVEVAYPDSRIVLTAAASRERAVAEDRALQHGESIISNELVAASSAQVPRMLAEWNIMAGALSTNATATSIPHLIPTLWLRINKDVFEQCMQNDDVESETLKELVEKWESLHTLIKFEDCDRLGTVPTLQRHCYEAERCVHEGDGLVLFNFFQKVTLAITEAGSLFPGGRKNFIQLLASGKLVFKFSWQIPAAPEESEELVSLAFWAALTFRVTKPYLRACFLRLDRYPPGDRHNVLGLSVYEGCGMISKSSLCDNL